MSTACALIGFAAFSLGPTVPVMGDGPARARPIPIDSPTLVAPTVPLSQCDEQWFRSVLSSPSYKAFRSGEIGPALVDPVEFGKLALADALTPEPNDRQIQRAWLYDSNSYSAAAFYAQLESNNVDDPSLAHYWLSRLGFLHRGRSTRELEATLFADIKDRPSFVTRKMAKEILFGSSAPRTVEVNMYSAFAEFLSMRTKPYMRKEWRRIAEFRNNPEARTAALGCLRMAPGNDKDILAFSSLVRDLRQLRERAGNYDVLKRPPPVLDSPSDIQQRAFDVSSIRFGGSPTYTLDILLKGTVPIRPAGASWGKLYPPLCERKSRHPMPWGLFKKPSEYLTGGPLILAGSRTNLDRMAELFKLIESRKHGTVPFDDGRVVIVFPTDKLTDGEKLTEFAIIRCLAGSVSLGPQGVFVVCTENQALRAVERLIEGVDKVRETIVPWPDGTQVAILRSKMRYVRFGGTKFLQANLPPDEDGRLVTFSGYGRFVILKASPKAIERLKPIITVPDVPSSSP